MSATTANPKVMGDNNKSINKSIKFMSDTLLLMW